ncbi:MAG: hypothetical protein ACOH2M_15330 [Cypionkella sp.]
MLFFQIVGTICAVCAIITAFRAYLDPEPVFHWLEQIEASIQPPLQLPRVLLAANLIGFGILVAGGVDNALGWMPSAWGGLDQEGDFTPFRVTLMLTAGAMGAYPAFSLVKRLAVLQFMNTQNPRP